MSLGPAEILVIIVIALLVFGPTRLPEVARQVGRTVREFKRFQQTMHRDLSEVFDDDAIDASDAAEPAPSLPPKTEGGSGDAASNGSGSEPGAAASADPAPPDASEARPPEARPPEAPGSDG